MIVHRSRLSILRALRGSSVAAAVPAARNEGFAGETPASTGSFTILELLVVITIIIVLAGLILSTVGYVQKKGARSRTEAEIAAMSAALESYKADNGIYPRGNATSPSTTPPYDTDKVDARKSGNPSTYNAASLYLYEMLAAGNPDGSSNTGTRSYMAFKPNQLARPDMSQPPSASNKISAVRDPFGNSYGYSTAFQFNQSTGYNPTFDLWSTSGLTMDPPITGTDTITPQWIKNW